MENKSQKSKVKILEKVFLKTKLIMKSTITQKSQLMVCRFAYEDAIIAAGYSDGCVRVYNLNTDNKISQIDTNVGKQQTTPVNCIRWRPNNESLASINSLILVGNTNGTLIQYVAKTGKQLFRKVEQGNFILAIDYAFNGKTFATAGKDNIVKIYDQETKTITEQLTAIKWHSPGHSNRIFSVKFMPNDPNIIASGGWDQNVKKSVFQVNIWDIRQGKSISTICGPKITGDSIDIRDDYLITGANRGNNQLELWDWRTRKVAMKFKWDSQMETSNAFLFCTQFCHNSKDTVIACGGNQLKMFNIMDGTELLQVLVDDSTTSLYTCDSSYNANKYIMGGKSGTIFHLTGIKPYE